MAPPRGAVLSGVDIRPASDRDDDDLWRIIEPILRAGETYSLPRDMSRADALRFWRAAPAEAFVAVDGEVVGTYFLRPNAMGGGAHVANAGYMTAAAARGRGVAGAMCEHSLDQARRRGFRAMQFNSVVGTNVGAIRLWEQHGFDVVGRLPGAFAHPRLGDVDLLVMFRTLSPIDAARGG
jgi:GNAT superfamily N-acetyltransferase